MTIRDLGHNEFESFGGALRPHAGMCANATRCELVRGRYLAAVALASAFLDEQAGALRPASQPSADELTRLGVQTEVATQPGATRRVAVFPPLEPPVDCRFEHDCEDGELALEHAQSALALLEDAPQSRKHPGLVHERGLLLARLGRYRDSAAAFDGEAAIFASLADDRPVFDALERRANRYADRARLLAASTETPRVLDADPDPGA